MRTFPIPPGQRTSVLQDWVMGLPFMQQSVLLAALRGPDGVVKNHPSKALCRWLRRCILISAFDRLPLPSPLLPGGGSYTGPSVVHILEDNEQSHKKDFKMKLPDYQWEDDMKDVVKSFLSSQDSLPLHFYLHFVHAAEVLGYKHEDERIRAWWFNTYHQFAHDLHLAVETEEQLDRRLNDNESQWRADESRFKA